MARGAARQQQASITHADGAPGGLYAKKRALRTFSIFANSHSLLHSGQLERVRSRLVDGRTAEALRATEALGAIAAAAGDRPRALRAEPSDGEWARAAGLASVGALRDALEAGARARDKLVAKNMGLVYKVAHSLQRSSRLSMHDLVQEGAAGLVRAKIGRAHV